MKIKIGNINTHNSDNLNEVAGIAGLAGCIESIDLCNAELNLLTAERRIKLAITDKQLAEMIGAFILDGYSIELVDTHI